MTGHATPELPLLCPGDPRGDRADHRPVHARTPRSARPSSGGDRRSCRRRSRRTQRSGNRRVGRGRPWPSGPMAALVLDVDAYDPAASSLIGQQMSNNLVRPDGRRQPRLHGFGTDGVAPFAASPLYAPGGWRSSPDGKIIVAGDLRSILIRPLDKGLATSLLISPRRPVRRRRDGRTQPSDRLRHPGLETYPTVQSDSDPLQTTSSSTRPATSSWHRSSTFSLARLLAVPTSVLESSKVFRADAEASSVTPADARSPRSTCWGRARPTMAVYLTGLGLLRLRCWPPAESARSSALRDPPGPARRSPRWPTTCRRWARPRSGPTCPASGDLRGRGPRPWLARPVQAVRHARCRPDDPRPRPTTRARARPTWPST